MNLNVLPGNSFPIGATVYQDPKGVNFSIYSKNATAIELFKVGSQLYGATIGDLS